jgi:hypothetical protein
MRRIDSVNNRKMKNVKSVTILDKKRIQIKFGNGKDIIVRAYPEDWGDDAGIYIEKDTI